MKFTDQTGSEIELMEFPTRIISVVPSQTELLYDLGLDKEVIGITKFCIHPEEWFRTKTRIGGTKKLDIEKIIQLQPDIIFANKEENEKSDIEKLKKLFPVWTSDIKDLDDAIRMIEEIGRITDREKNAASIAGKISEQFDNMHYSKSISCVYLIWNDPIMTIGGDTFINDMLSRAGFKNLTFDRQRYPQLTSAELQTLNPECLLLSSEPYPFDQKHMNFYRDLLPNSKIVLADGEMFSWYGSRLIKAPLYFSALRSEIENAS